MNTPVSIDRRQFIKGSLAAAAGLTLLSSCSTYPKAPRRVKPRVVSANSRINIAFIGAGGRGMESVHNLAPTENIVAFCDVDDESAAEIYKEFPDVPRFRDFRVMLDKMEREIDAVVISTPDHTHFVATLAAMERGMHVYTEKPLTHDIWQARTLSKAADYYGVVTIMGNQGHTTEGIRYIKEWYDAGVLGEVREVLAWFNSPPPPGVDNYWFKMPTEYPLPRVAVPKTIDWDLWTGPLVNGLPYHPDLAPRKWRCYHAYGSGILGDWACHTLDGPNWSLGLGAPDRVELETYEGSFMQQVIPQKSIVRFDFEAAADRPPVTMRWYDGGLKPENRPEWGLETLEDRGMIMVGSKATLMTGGRPDSPRLIPNDVWMDFRKTRPEKTIPRIKGGPWQEWTDAIRGDGPMPGSCFAYGAELTELALVGVMAQRAGGVIDWDKKNMRVTNRPELNAYVKQPVKRGWDVGNELWL